MGFNSGLKGLIRKPLVVTNCPWNFLLTFYNSIIYWIRLWYLWVFRGVRGSEFTDVSGDLPGPSSGFRGPTRRPEKTVYFNHWTPGKNSEVPDFNINRSESMKSCKLVDTGTAWQFWRAQSVIVPKCQIRE